MKKTPLKQSARGIRILIVDSEVMMRKALRRNLVRMGIHVMEASTPSEAILVLDREDVDLVLAETGRNGDAGRTLLHSIRGRRRSPAVIVMSEQSSIDDAVRYMHDGAFYYLEKPINLNSLEELIPRAFAESGAPVVGTGAEAERSVLYSPSSPMATVMELVRRLAQFEAPVLINGESGTGKELIARAIHTLSERGSGPLVAVNCAAIPENLIESELFGHDKGAFTGADRQRAGRFKEANGGTLFLDEVGELSPDAQSKLLRVLQDGSYRPVGGSRDLYSDARIIAATNRDLEAAVEEGSFRQDLFYRLSVVPVPLPPLRERGVADISLLSNHFIDRYNDRYRTKIRSFTQRAWEALLRYPWPGNVRELEHLVQQQVILVSGTDIDLDTLPERFRVARAAAKGVDVNSLDRMLEVGDELPEDGLHLAKLVENIQIHYLQAALRKSEGNKTAAASILRMKRTTFIEKLKRFGLL